MMTSGYPAHDESPRSSLHRIRAALQAHGIATPTPRDDEFSCLCPVHDDHRPSLSVAWKPDGEKVVAFCHACEAKGEDVAEAIGMPVSDLWDKPLQRDTAPLAAPKRTRERRKAGRRRGKQGPTPARLTSTPTSGCAFSYQEWTLTNEWTYVTGAGEIVQRVRRFACPTGCCKTFRPLFPVGDGWQSEQPAGFTPVLYRQPELDAAIAAGRPVWLTEGEKDADRAAALGEPATTNAKGAGGFPPELAGQFRGVEVRVVLDRDRGGFRRGETLSELLAQAGASSVQLLLPATEAEKSDLSDHLDAGHALEQLQPISVATCRAQRLVREIRDVVQGPIATAEAECHARLDRSERDEARRWATNAETGWEQIAPLVTDLMIAAGEGGDPDGTLVELGRELQQQARVRVRGLFEVSGLDIPERLAPPAPATASDVGGPAVVGGQLIEKDDYQVVDEEGDTTSLVRISYPRNRSGEPQPRWQRVLTPAVWLTARELHEDREQLRPWEQEEDALPGYEMPGTVAGYWVAYHHGASGEVMEAFIPTDRWKDGSWIDGLKLAAIPQYDTSPRGVALVRTAVMQAKANEVATRIRPAGTGWRLDPELGPVFLHAGGRITAAGGDSNGRVMERWLRAYSFTEPTEDAGTLRRDWSRGIVPMLTNLDAAVTAPLLGQVFVSALGKAPKALTVSGPPGSLKTAHTALAMHCFGTRFDRDRPTFSAAKFGDTSIAAQTRFIHLLDVPAWGDDTNPDLGLKQAKGQLDDFARMSVDGTTRGRGGRNGDLNDPGKPETSLIQTTELAPTPGTSGERRQFVVPMHDGDADLEHVIELDEPDRRLSRNRVMASVIMWMARHNLPELRRHYRDIMAAETRSLRRDHGVVTGLAEGASAFWAGWVLVTDCLRDQGAISEEERQGLLGMVAGALNQAIAAARDVDAPQNAAEYLMRGLRSLLTSGEVYIAGVEPGSSSLDEPPTQFEPAQLGWREGALERRAWELRSRAGVRLGWIYHCGSEVRVAVPTENFERVLPMLHATFPEAPEMDLRTATASLRQHGVLVHEPGRMTAKVPALPWLKRRPLVLRWDAVVSADPDNDDGPGPSGWRPPQLGPDYTGPGGTVVDLRSAAEDRPPVPDDEDLLLVASTASELTTPPPPGEEATVTPTTVYLCRICHEPMDTEVVIATGWDTHPGCADPKTTVRIAEPAASPEATADPTRTRPETVATEPASADVDPKQSHQPASTSGNRPRPAAASTSRRRSPAVVGPVVSAAVLTPDGAWLPDGTCVRVDFDQIQHLGDLALLGHHLQLGTMLNTQPPRRLHGQIWVTGEVLERFGIASDMIGDEQDAAAVMDGLTADHPLITGAQDAGWTIAGISEIGGIRGWVTVWHPDRQLMGVRVALIPAMRGDTGSSVLAGDPHPAAIARRLQLFADHVRHPWVLSGGRTGRELMLNLRRGEERQRLYAAYDPVPAVAASLEHNELNWSRPPTKAETGCRWLHAYDRNAAYLAAAAGQDLGVGEARHLIGPDIRFDPTLPGFWQVELPPLVFASMPHPLDSHTAWDSSRQGALRWLTTPTLRLGLEDPWNYDDLVIHEAYVWDEHTRLLSSWQKRLADARRNLPKLPGYQQDEDAQAAYTMVKMAYTRGIGMMAWDRLAGQEGYSLERHRMLVARARETLLRKVRKIGLEHDRWPVAITADTIIYPSDDPDPRSAWPGDPDDLDPYAPGKFKPEGTVAMADHLPFLTGRGRYAGKAQFKD